MKRNSTIDFLRGVAIIAMIFIHTSYYFISNPFVEFAWNYTQFAVPVFVFCSAWLFFGRENAVIARSSTTKQSHTDSGQSRMTSKKVHINFEYVSKRFIRLLKPYYIFLLFFIPLVWWQDHSKVTAQYIFKSLIVWDGGVDIGWLVLLFLQFVFVMPFLSWSFSKNKVLFYLYAAFSFGSSVVFLFYHFPFKWQWILWLPWSVVLIFTLCDVHFKTKLFRPAVFAISGIIYFVLWVLFELVHHSPSFFDNKYPPNLYFLSFGIAGILALIYLEKIVPKFFHKFIHFFSLYSYPIFFIHYWFLIFLQQYLKFHIFTWWSFFGAVIGLTVAVQVIINQVQRFKKI